MSVNDAAFRDAFRRYLAKTSKTLAEAINWKAADLMLQAAHFTPKTALRADFPRKESQNPRLVSHRTGRKHGNSEGKGWTREQWDTVRNAMALRTLGKGFMRSAFVKAAAKIPRTRKPTRRASLLAQERMDKSKADVHLATGQIQSLAARLLWEAHSPKDAAAKQSMVEKSMARALPAVTADMIRYLNGENKRNAKEVSS